MEETHTEKGFTAPTADGFSADDKLAEAFQTATAEHANDEEDHEHMHHQEFTDESLNQENLNNSVRRKKKNPFQKRIDQLVYEKGNVEQNNVFLAQQLAEKEAYLAQQQARLHEYEQQLSQKDHYANEYFENSLETQEHALKQRLRQAKENDDIDAEVELVDQLAELKATRTTHEAWKIQEQVKKQQQLEDETYIPNEIPIRDPYLNTAPVDLEMQEWVRENPWYNTPKLRAEADAIADELANVLNFNNYGHLIGTTEFRDNVKSLMDQKYNLNGESNSGSSRSSVAPVGRSSSMAQNYMGNRNGHRQGAALSKEEYELARHLPVKRKDESEVDLVKRYQKAKNYPRSPLAGGSPYRLTII